MLVYFIIFFILGYLLFATIYVALGAMVNTDQDAQQLQFAVMMFVIMVFILAFYIIKNPTANLSKIISLGTAVFADYHVYSNCGANAAVQ